MSIFNPTASGGNGLQNITFDILNAFYSYEHFIILGHSKPDADCISSQLAMYLALKKIQKNCQLVSAGPFSRPEVQGFSSKFQGAIQQSDLEKALVIILDCSTRERTGLAQQFQDLPVLVIDHHASGENDGDLQYCDSAAPSTSMLVYNILLQLPLFLFQMDPDKYFQQTSDYLMDRELANILFLGFATDTGFFRFLKPENAGNMLRLVANLVDTKINLQDTYQHMTGGRILGTRRILGLLLLRAGFLLQGRLCVSYEMLEDKKHWQVEGNDSDSFYALSLATQNCEAILLVDQAEQGLWNVGLRSLKQHDVGTIAAKFGGGGHKNAAGCRIESEKLVGALKVLLTELCGLWDEDAVSLPEVRDYIESAPRYLVHEIS